jgi:hypothetical protein
MADFQKLFVEAIQSLAVDITQFPGFEVVFVGAEAQIDGIVSKSWIERQCGWLPFPIKIFSNLPHDKAIKLIKANGTLLVLCSVNENAPYVTAEAASLEVPFVQYDVGGVREIVQADSDTLIPFDIKPEASVAALRSTLERVLRRGTHQTATVRESYRSGGRKWRDWHRSLAMNGLMPRDLERKTARNRGASLECSKPVVYHVEPGIIPSPELSHRVCGGNGMDSDTIIILPDGFKFDPLGAWKEYCRLFQGEIKESLAFGAWTPKGRAAFPTSPTWFLYDGTTPEGWWPKIPQCAMDVPLIMQRSTFCGSHHGYSRTFPTFSTWGLITMLKLSGVNVHTFPAVVFNLTNWTHHGTGCIFDEDPPLGIDYQTTANLVGDPQITLMQRMAPRQVSKSFWAKVFSMTQKAFYVFAG